MLERMIKNDSRVFLTTAPSLFGGEMKLGERSDAAFMTTLMHDDIGNEENHKHHLSVDQVQCAKRFCTFVTCLPFITEANSVFRKHGFVILSTVFM